MKKLILAVLFVSIILCGFIAILNSLPFCSNVIKLQVVVHLWKVTVNVRMQKKDVKIANSVLKKWMDAAGKYHKEIKVISTNENNEVMCPMAEGDHSGCCKCCLKNSSGSDSINYDSVHIKVRHPL